MPAAGQHPTANRAGEELMIYDDLIGVVPFDYHYPSSKQDLKVSSPATLIGNHNHHPSNFSKIDSLTKTTLVPLLPRYIHL